MVEPYLHLNGRRMILTDETEVNIGNVVQILRKALPYHWKNRSEISYLWSYYKGRQPILNRVKEVRPEITNKIVENRANEIVSFKSGYLMGEPLQYVSRGNAENIADAINQLNEFVFAEEKPAKDKELADWFHICGTSFRMVLPDEMAGEDDESPFEIYTLDPRNTFVVYNNGLGNKPTGGSQDSIADGVREGMYDATARQNELLKEQNELLRQIASKDFTAEITTDSFTKAMNRKNQRDGKTIIPVTT